MENAELELMIRDLNEQQTKEITKTIRNEFVCKLDCQKNQQTLKEKYIWPLTLKMAGAAGVLSIGTMLIAMFVRKGVFG